MVTDLGRLLMMMGALVFVVGLLLVLGGRFPWLGNLPGDIRWSRGNFQLYAPCGTMIVLSLLLTLILNLVTRLFR
jgi:hypothetical protein